MTEAQVLQQQLAEAEAENERLRAALRNLVNAVETYTSGSLGEVEDAAREALGEEG